MHVALDQSTMRGSIRLVHGHLLLDQWLLMLPEDARPAALEHARAIMNRVRGQRVNSAGQIRVIDELREALLADEAFLSLLRRAPGELALYEVTLSGSLGYSYVRAHAWAPSADEARALVHARLDETDRSAKLIVRALFAQGAAPFATPTSDEGWAFADD